MPKDAEDLEHEQTIPTEAGIEVLSVQDWRTGLNRQDALGVRSGLFDPDNVHQPG